MLKGITTTLNQVYAMIAEDELQQLVCASVTSKKLNPIAMQINKNTDTNYRNQNYKAKECDYCHFTGHTRDNCYKLIGYPIDWK